jgi:hypothetical protein
VALSEIEQARVQRAMDALMKQRRPPPHVRQKLDLGFRVTGQSVEIFEIRPVWRGQADARLESAVAKATYVRARGVWRMYWQRRDLKWHAYEPRREVNSIAEFASLVAEDAQACFFG